MIQARARVFFFFAERWSNLASRAFFYCPRQTLAERTERDIFVFALFSFGWTRRCTFFLNLGIFFASAKAFFISKRRLVVARFLVFCVFYLPTNKTASALCARAREEPNPEEKEQERKQQHVSRLIVFPLDHSRVDEKRRSSSRRKKKWKTSVSKTRSPTPRFETSFWMEDDGFKRGTRKKKHGSSVEWIHVVDRT